MFMSSKNISYFVTHLTNEQFYDYYPSPNTIHVIKQELGGGAGHVAGEGQEGCTPSFGGMT